MYDLYIRLHLIPSYVTVFCFLFRVSHILFLLYRYPNRNPTFPSSEHEVLSPHPNCIEALPKRFAELALALHWWQCC